MAQTTIKPKRKRELASIINDFIDMEGWECNLNFIDTSEITDMSYLFAESSFNGDISEWNTSNVKDMSFMFAESSFNGDISKWNTSNVEDMSYMFKDSIFNGDISQWNTSNVKNMGRMFECSRFKGNISAWLVPCLGIVLLYMFYIVSFTYE